MRHPLYDAALQADDDLTTILQAETGRDRWTLTAADYLNPAVRKALTAKLDADAAWLQAMRESRNPKPTVPTVRERLDDAYWDALLGSHSADTIDHSDSDEAEADYSRDHQE